jgi:hypothetical protein
MRNQTSSNDSGGWTCVDVDWDALELPVVVDVEPPLHLVLLRVGTEPVRVRPEHEAVFDRDRGLV